jgi:hypothetical protein
MLYIRGAICTIGKTSKLEEYTWRTGEELPVIHSRVVTFQADCDELDVIMDALKAASKKPVVNLE